MYKKVKFGELEDGREVFQYTLTNRNGVTDMTRSKHVWSTAAIWARLLEEMQTG